VTNAFTLDVNAVILGFVDTLCTGDYIQIPGQFGNIEIIFTTLHFGVPFPVSAAMVLHN
jgi:hypothetical protein